MRIGIVPLMSILKAAVFAAVVVFSGSFCQARLVLLQEEMPDLVIDLRYAGTRNLTGAPLYPDDRAWLHPEAVRRLKVVQAKLRRNGLQLILWDAYRPPEAHARLFKAFPNANFVASPKLGSRHSRGTSVDVGLADLAGKPVPVPTDHDVFTPAADHDFRDLPRDAAAHAELLRRAMFDSGWSGVPAEWWHYDLRNWRDYPVIPAAPR